MSTKQADLSTNGNADADVARKTWEVGRDTTSRLLVGA
jgi:hypothetical protein